MRRIGHQERAAAPAADQQRARHPPRPERPSAFPARGLLPAVLVALRDFVGLGLLDEDRPAARSFELLNERVLTVAGVYGPNASGKSNLLDALAWLSNAVGSSLRGWDEEVPRDPHQFRSGTSVLSQEYVVDMWPWSRRCRRRSFATRTGGGCGSSCLSNAGWSP